VSAYLGPAVDAVTKLVDVDIRLLEET
jgi:hypothetical protein